MRSFHNKLLGELTAIWELFPNSEVNCELQNSAGADVVKCAKLTLTKNFDVKTTMKEIKAMAQEICKMSIFYPKTSKNLYHHIKCRKSIMNREVFYKKSCP